jgi:hypothetical protein
MWIFTFYRQMNGIGRIAAVFCSICGSGSDFFFPRQGWIIRDNLGMFYWTPAGESLFLPRD